MLSSRFFPQITSILRVYGPTFEVELKINTDSRSLKNGETFVALYGENFDGFNYVEQVLSLGAKVIIYSKKEGRESIVQQLSKNHSNVLFVETTDSLKCMQSLAALYNLSFCIF